MCRLEILERIKDLRETRYFDLLKIDNGKYLNRPNISWD